jgi:hypothetical protein
MAKIQQDVVLNGDYTENAFSDGPGGIVGDDQRLHPKDLRERIEAVFRQIGNEPLCACPVYPPLLLEAHRLGRK